MIAEAGKQTANVLIVDDVTTNLAILTEMIKSAGYIARPVSSVRQAQTAIAEKMPQLILLDISMPEIDGFEFCEMLKANVKTRDVPVIFISAMTSSEDKSKAFKLGAVDFIMKPFELEEVTLRVNTHLKIYNMQQELELYNKRLHKIVNDQIKKVSMEQKNIIYALAKLSEARDDANGNHMVNVGENCKLLAQSLQFSPKFEKVVSNSFVDAIELAAPLHDIGKVAISDRILLKQGKLNQDEMEVVKTHTEVGARTLMEIYSHNEHNDFIRMAIDIAYYHHERWDGKGYPKGLSGTQIPLSARIMSIIDVYDTLISERCYKEAYTHEESMHILLADAGKSFDPDIIDVLVKVQNQLRRD